MNDPFGLKPYPVSKHFDVDLPMYPESHKMCEFCNDEWCSDDEEDMNADGDYSLTVCFDCENSGLYDLEEWRHGDMDDGGLPAIQETVTPERKMLNFIKDKINV